MRKKLTSLMMLAMPFIVIAFFSIISMISLGSIMLKSCQAQIIADKQRSIEDSFERFLQRIETIETLSYMISRNDMMEQYVYKGYSKDERTLIESIEIKDMLNSFMINDNVVCVYYYDLKDDHIITSQTVLSDASLFFRFAYQLEGFTPAESVERLKKHLRGCDYSSSQNAFIEMEPMKVIEYRTALPLGVSSNVQGQLILVIDAEEVFSDFINLLENGSEFYIYDNYDNLIYGSGDQYEALLESCTTTDLKSIHHSNEKVYSMMCQSYNRSWKVKVFVSDLMSQNIIETMDPYVWILIVMQVIICILLCVYFTHKNHSQIMDILILFKNQREGLDEKSINNAGGNLKILREYTDQMIDENSQFKKSIIHYENLQKYVVLDKLVRNTYGSSEEMMESLTNIDLHVKEEKCVAFCIRYEDSCYRLYVSEGLTVKDLVKEQLGNILQRRHEIFDTSARETVCILAIDDENLETLVRDVISHLSIEVIYRYDIEVKMGVGNVVKSIYHISDSYMQAKEVLNYSEISENKVYTYLELQCLVDAYYYPREYDEKIHNYVIAGNLEKAKEIVQMVYRENFQNASKRLSVRAIEMIRSRLSTCVISLAEKYSIAIDDEVARLDDEQNIKLFFENIYCFLNKIAEEVGLKKKSLQSHSASKIMNYVKENYCDATLSLKQISSTFGFSEAYISNLFKTVYGENLFVEIEKLRIQKACDLIKNTNMKIGEIAEAVGYTSDASFRRAFKKITGVSPAEYRVL